ncbi:MAG TPA: glutamate formimidoyltransferase [Vicinamibacterales bacterium]|nr:glutamate formimidoyltransferase [Vicinamibacterales bacterium]
MSSTPGLIECVPNVSEGRNRDLIARMAESVRATPDVRLLNHSSDAAHHRSVFTFVGSAEGVQQAALSIFQHAVEGIDLRRHSGVHPRLGAVDVVPFVPLQGATMAQCVAIAKATGAAAANRFGVPVYLYEEAASNPIRTRLEDIRRGAFEGLRDKMSLPEWAPDFGPRHPHPSAGASVVGARHILIAYNVNLDSDRLDVARAIAKTIRQSSGGLPFVKAMGVRLDSHLVQVSMNLTNYERTPMWVVYDAVVQEAVRHGVKVRGSELIGLVPQAALRPGDETYLKIEGFTSSQILERQIG